MVEQILLIEHHFTLEQPSFVTTFSQTGGIGYLRMRSSTIIPHAVLEKLDHAVGFGMDKSTPPRGDMAIDALDMAVGGCFPTLHVRLHEMAR